MEKTTTAAQKIFFSYSRQDGQDCTFKLANDLRAAGANVWVDQQDIEPGKNWDVEIETALNAADCVLFVATPKSVLSNNVQNELGHALEENKKVIPVVFYPCKIPFRLSRLQRIDFTTDYNAAFERLLKALGLPGTKVSPTQVDKRGEPESSSERPTATAGETIDLPKETTPKSAAPKQTEHFTKEEAASQKSESREPVAAVTTHEAFTQPFEKKEKPGSKRPLLWGIGALAAAAIIFFVAKGISSSAAGGKGTDTSAVGTSQKTAPADSLSMTTQKEPGGSAKTGEGETPSAGDNNSPSTDATGNEKRFEDYKKSGLKKFENKDYSGAVDDLLKAFALKPDAEAAYHLGRSYGLLQDYSNAVVYYGKAINLNPKNWQYFNARGNAYRKAGNYTDAATDYSNAIALAPTEGLPYAGRGLCKKALNDATGACQDFSTAMNLGNAEGKTAYTANCTQKSSVNPNLLRTERVKVQPNTDAIRKVQKALKN